MADQFKDVTKEWLKKVKINDNNYKKRSYFKKDGIKYYVNNKTVMHDHTEIEEKMALFIQKTFGGNIYMIPRVIDPNYTRTPDYQYINSKLNINDYFDLKTIQSNDINIVDNKIKKSWRQSENFILDFGKSNLTNDEIILQIQKLYDNKMRRWVNIIIIKKHNFIRIFRRQKRAMLASPKWKRCLTTTCNIRYFIKYVNIL